MVQWSCHKPMSKISHKHTYCVCLCKSANYISLGEDMLNSSNERTLMNCAKDVSLITVKNGCDSWFYVAKLQEIKDSNTDCRYIGIRAFGFSFLAKEKNGLKAFLAQGVARFVLKKYTLSCKRIEPRENLCHRACKLWVRTYSSLNQLHEGFV